MSIRTLVVIMITSFLVSACQTTNSAKNTNISVNNKLLVDSKFPHFQATQIESEQQIFALDDDIKSMVVEKLIPERDISKRAKKLLRQIFKTRDIGLVYSSTANLVATDSFNSNKANCLSLTILAYALAKEAKLNIRFQQVDIPEFWIRNGSYNMLTGHVNLLLVTESDPTKTIIYGKNSLQIDFDPYVAKKTFPTRMIKKATIVAMYYNNKGAQAIVEKKYNDAYAYFRSSVFSDPAYSTAWGNLGLLYRLNNQNNLAEDTYQYALSLNKNNLTTLANYAVLLDMNGKFAAVKKIETLLSKKRQRNPYYQALLADEAFADNNYQLTVKYYKKAISLNKNIHEFYFGLAKAYYQLNYLVKAKRAIKKAIVLNHHPNVENQYIAKLNLLKSSDSIH